MYQRESMTLIQNALNSGEPISEFKKIFKSRRNIDMNLKNKDNLTLLIQALKLE